MDEADEMQKLAEIQRVRVAIAESVTVTQDVTQLSLERATLKRIEATASRLKGRATRAGR